MNVEAGTHNITLNYEKQSEIFLWLIVVIGICVLGFLTVFINKNQLLKGMLKGAWLAQDKLMVGAVFLIGFILLLMQHLTLDIFYDDYANAALCYGNVIEGVEGTNYTTSQLWEWVKWCYMNWGGRVLYAALFSIPKAWNTDCPMTIIKNLITPWLVSVPVPIPSCGSPARMRTSP